MTQLPLGDLEVDDIDNVYIFLADALRYDKLPEAVKKRGLSFKTVAHALATPQCLPTIVSGQLPPKHGVVWFQHTIPDYLSTIFDISGHNTGYSELVWPGHALRDVLGNPKKVSIETVEEPFIAFEHDNGGHAPYPQLDGDSPGEMLYDINSPDELLVEYREAVSQSTHRFEERLDILADRDMLDNTLVIYMSDHGQLLGEHGGFFGHGLPMTPEVAYVPTVFIHPSLPQDKQGDHLLKAVDLYPTIINVLTGEEVKSDGEDLTKPVKIDRPTYSQGIIQPPAKYRGTTIDPAYDARSIWTKNGGHVFVKNPRTVRAITAVYEAMLSGNTAAYNSQRSTLRTASSTLAHYLKNYHQYDLPAIDKMEAKKLLDHIDTEVNRSDTRELSEETKEQLADLGYR